MAEYTLLYVALLLTVAAGFAYINHFLLKLPRRASFVAAAGIAIPLALIVRAFSVTAASLPLHLGAAHKLRAISLLTWSGLRGGISVSLALSLPPTPYRASLLTACYGVVIFTMLAQDLTLAPIAAWLYPKQQA